MQNDTPDPYGPNPGIVTTAVRRSGTISDGQARGVYQTMVDTARSRYEETLARIRSGHGAPGMLEVAKLDRDEAVQRARDYASANGWHVPSEDELPPVNTPQEIFDQQHSLHRTAALGRDANGYPDGIHANQLALWREAVKDFNPNPLGLDAVEAARRNAQPEVRGALDRIGKWLDSRAGPEQRRELIDGGEVRGRSALTEQLRPGSPVLRTPEAEMSQRQRKHIMRRLDVTGYCALHGPHPATSGCPECAFPEPDRGPAVKRVSILGKSPAPRSLGILADAFREARGAKQ